MSNAVAHEMSQGDIALRTYSVLNATTGSLFAALFAGARPEMRVRTTLRHTRKIALPTGSDAIFE